MFVTFKLELDGGNDAMQTKDDIADALTYVAEWVRKSQSDGTVRDANGNTIGEWRTR